MPRNVRSTLSSADAPYLGTRYIHTPWNYTKSFMGGDPIDWIIVYACNTLLMSSLSASPRASNAFRSRIAYGFPIGTNYCLRFSDFIGASQRRGSLLPKGITPLSKCVTFRPSGPNVTGTACKAVCIPITFK